MIKKLLIKNIWIKLICILMSTALWIFVVSIQNTIAKFPSSINLTLNNIQTGLVATCDQKSVEIRIMADPEIWQRLSSDSFKATIDLSGYGVGSYDLPITVTTGIAGVKIIKISPENALVTLDKITQKTVPIAARVDGELGSGMMIGDIAFSPDSIGIEGPKSKLETIKEVSALIRLNGEKESFSRDVVVSALDDLGNEVEGVKLDRTNATATISVVKGSNIRTVGIKAKFANSLAQNYYIKSVTISPETLDIEGNTAAISKIRHIETAEIDLANKNTSFQTDVNLNIPSEIAGLTSITKVRVSVEIAETLTPKEIVVSNIRVLNGNATLVGELRVSLSGPASLIGSLLAKDVVLLVDLAGKTADAEGRFTIDLGKNNFSLPDGLTLESFAPAKAIFTQNR
jgi:YbbR domain-containing protein